MSHGLRIWDAAGQPTLTVTDRITRFVGTYTAVVLQNTMFVDVSVPECTPQTHCAFASNGLLFFEVFSGFVRCHRFFNIGNSNMGSLPVVTDTFHVVGF